MDFTNAQKNAPNPWLRRLGRQNDLVSDPVNFYGLGVLGAMNPARANTDIESETSEEIDGYATCLTEVAETAPFSEDEIGTQFDNDNLRWVRTRVWRRSFANGGGDKEWWTAVPKTLPAEYTAVGRCSLMDSPQLIQDWLGNDPSIGFQWNHRTANGLLWDPLTNEGLSRALWSPMNLNQQIVSAPLDEEIVSVGDGFTYYLVYLLQTFHVGFRAGRITAQILPPFPVPNTVSQDYTIGCMDIDDSWTSGHPGDSGVQDLETFSLSHSFGVGEGIFTQTVSLGDMRPPTSGRVKNFIAYSGPYDTRVFQYLVNGSVTADLSPRTDVPLPYFASQRNRVAPGGIILPA